MMFGDAKALHKSFLMFSSRCDKKIKYKGHTYSIKHCQFASYPIRDLFETLVEHTSASPLDADYDTNFTTEFEREAIEAIKMSNAYVCQDLKSFYRKREYIEETEFIGVVTDYETAVADEKQGDENIITPKAETRKEAIAEIISLINGNRACMGSDFSLKYEDKDDDSKPDPGKNKFEAYASAYHVVSQKHGIRPLRRPDPSLSTIQELYKIYNEIGINPDIRNIYGLFVDTVEPSRVAGEASKKTSSGDLTRWTNPSEPPLTSLPSYKDFRESR